MFEFGVRNIRRLQSAQHFAITPITLLVGRNSSGKSTYLRSLPLLRQSIVTRTSSPVLWYGDSVDFGSFEQSVHDNNSGETIAFSFGLDDIRGTQRISISPDPESYSYILRQFEYNGLFLEITISKYKNGTRISKILFSEKTNDVTYEAIVGEDGRVTSLRIDDTEMSQILHDEDLIVSSGAILPQFFVRPKKVEEGSSLPSLTRPDAYLSVRDEIAKIVAQRLDGRTTGATLQKLISSLMVASKISQETIKLTLNGISNRSWIKLINEITGIDRRGDFPKIRRLLLAASFSIVLNRTCYALRDVISSSLYIGPARARSERYYRYQDLSVSEIDPDGKNFPMFLSSLRDPQLRSFSIWVQSIFSYGVTIVRESGHISIKLTSEAGDVNIVDTGYGVSQILPVLGQIWWANNRPARPTIGATSPPIICIEQPELHLHPAHQSLLADTFVNSVKIKPGSDINMSGTRLIIETHSETLINRMGQLISQGKIPASDVQILMFEINSEEQTSTSVKIAKFDDSGFLTNWPFGFFLPE